MKAYDLRILCLAASFFAGAGAAFAQDSQPQPQSDDEPVRVGEGVTTVQPIAIPYMPTPAAADTAAGNTEALGRQIAQIVATDLGNSGNFTPIGPGGLPAVAFPQVQAPDYPAFSATGANNLVQGFVQANGNGTLTVGCYLYDTAARTELTRQGFVVAPALWRGQHLFAADRRGRLFRHPHRLCLGDGAGAAADQAAGDHGL